MSLLSVENLL